MSKRTCAFCPATANLTGEHLFADWISRTLTTSTSRYVFTRVEPGDRRKTRRWPGKSLDLKFRSVCDKCNNGWMSELDNEARHSLKDVIRYAAPVSFLPLGIASIAAFALKNAFIADRLHEKPFFGTYDRAQFRKHLEFPPGIHMWIGSVATSHLKKHGIYKGRYAKPVLEGAAGIHAYVFTWAAEALVLQVAAARWTRVLWHKHGWPQVSQDSHLDGVLVPFWPPDGRAITWPPPHHIPSESLETVADRFTMIRFT